jgi:molybdenum cofactor guanylyltransferase
MSSVTTIVLAGGNSTRMGRDKALIEIGDRPLIQRITDVAIASTDRVFITTSWPERYCDRVAPSCQFVHDRLNQGPLVAFAQTLPQVQTDWILLLSCDLPNINTTTLQTWIKYLPTLPESTIAYLPQSEKGWEPLCGFYHRQGRESLKQFVAQGGRSFQRWLQTQVVEVLEVSDRQVLFNCNTPEDLELIKPSKNSI